MVRFAIRLSSMVAGLFLYALGIVVTLKADIGYTPWDVLHVGVAKTAGLSIGTVSILTGLAILVIVTLLGEKIGLGTILNMILIGVFVDLLLAVNVIPLSGNYIAGTAMLIAGLFIISVGSYFYIKSGFCAGPRDSLMVALTRKTKLPVGLCRGSIELAATIAGWLLGGMVGIGTVISVIAIGFCIQITFKLFRFDATAVKHETLNHTLKTPFKRTP